MDLPPVPPDSPSPPLGVQTTRSAAGVWNSRHVPLEEVARLSREMGSLRIPPEGEDAKAVRER